MSGPISVDIVSDTLCPWCFIGKRRFERAVAARPGIDLVVTWHPYQLDPGIPPAGVDYRTRMESKFGAMARVDAAHARVRDIGASVGIGFAFERITRAPDTIATHCIARWAHEQGGAALQGAVVERLFQGFFEVGADLTDHDLLAKLAGAAGMDAELVREYLASGRDRDTVRAEADGWRRAGVDGVPTFLFERRWAVSGAQEAETFVSVLDRVAAGGKPGMATSG